VKRIKTFALWESESGPSIYDEGEIEQIQKALEPYVEFPELHRKNFLAWKYVVSGNSYNSYLTLSNDKNPLPLSEYAEYLAKWKAEDIRYPAIPPKWEFSSFVGGITAGRDLKTLVTWEFPVKHLSIERMQEIWKKPKFPCSIIYHAINYNYQGPNWVKIN
jgi:hypothetical protein